MVKKSGDFRYFSLYFLDENNNIIKESEYVYGADLTKLRYPKLLCDNGSYIEWQKPTEDIMLSNLVLRAQVEDNVPIIASDYQVDNKPSGSDAAYMQIHLEADNVEETDEIKLRVLTTNPKETVIYGYLNNTWQSFGPVLCHRDTPCHGASTVVNQSKA